MRLPVSIIAIILFGFSFPGASSAAAPAAACTACHADQADAEVNARAHFRPDAAPSDVCVTCHTRSEGHPAAKSDSAVGIMAFRGESAADKTAVCASCHPTQHSGTGLAEHGRAGVACSDCHRIHRVSGTALPPAGFDKIDSASATCVACHEGVFAQFAFNERHRLAEGAVSCVSCHDPHQIDGGRLAGLGGFAHEPCKDCHADVTGPFVFEHAASRVDGCGSCHEPHGSPNRHLLTHQQQGALCYSCHAMVPQFHTGFGPGGPPRFGLDTVCTSCHATIHGSNFDRNFLR